MNGVLPVDQPVLRVAAASDYTNGRIGKIVEIDAAARRYRVLWTHESNGKQIRGGKGVRTWVQYPAVKPIQTSDVSEDMLKPEYGTIDDSGVYRPIS